jgi:acetyltransferase-like isoleucine patch superfamily enzyme
MKLKIKTWKEIIKNNIIRLKLASAGPYERSAIFGKYFGVKFGKNVRIVDAHIDFGSEPYLIEIGNDVTISSGVTFVTHDGGIGLFRNEYPNIEKIGRIKVGNNVFIGMKVTICAGVTIGNNVVIGIGSIVTKNVPNNVIVAGIPAKFIKTIEEYKTSCLEKGIYISSHYKEYEKRKNEIIQKLDK